MTRLPRIEWGSVVPASASILLIGELLAAQVQVSNQTQAAALLLNHSPQQSEIMPWVTGGMAAGDFNRDGLVDLFVISGGAELDRLFINQGGGVFEDQAFAWGLTETHCGSGAAAGDYDSDGWLDIYVTSMGDPVLPDHPGANRLYRNTGQGTFENVAAAAGVAVASRTSAAVFGAAWGDYDLDGHLDLFVANWEPFEDGNRLFHNDGDGTFTDVTDFVIDPSALDDMYGFQPAFADLDGDRYPEILIASDFQTSRYLVNNGDGSFDDITVASGTGLDDNGMGQTVGDFDNDGRLDWYVTSIYQDSPPPSNYPGNTLYRNIGNHLYQEIGAATGCDDGGWAWGTIALDLDHDGWLDIVEVNGREAGEDGEWTNEPSKLFRNDGTGSFTEIAAVAGLDHVGSGRSVVSFDTENDGDLDVVILTNSGPLAYYENLAPADHHWLQLEFDTTNHPLLPPDGFGTRVEAQRGADTWIRYLNGSPSFLGTSQLVAHFGLGTTTTLDELRIKWTRGQVTILTDVAADQKLTIQAPDPADINADAVVDVSDLLQIITKWGAVTSDSMASDLNNDGEIDVTDLVTVISNWGPSTPPL